MNKIIDHLTAADTPQNETVLSAVIFLKRIKTDENNNKVVHPTVKHNYCIYITF